MSNTVDSSKEPILRRPRNLFTNHNAHTPMDENVQVFDVPTLENWSTNMYSNPGSLFTPSAILNAPIWRYPRTHKFFPFYAMDDSCVYQYEDQEATPGSAVATAHGTVSLRLNHKMRVDLTVDKAIRIINLKNNIVIAMNSTGSTCALLHPNGRVHQYGSRVEIMAYDPRGSHKYAKMWYKGISFTSESCALVYLVDSAGTRTTTDNFSDLSMDFSLSVFYNESRHGANFIPEAATFIESAQYWVTDEMIENWIINNVRISQAPDGLVRVARNSNKYNLRTSASNGTASITTPFLHCTASMGSTSHLFVRRGERRLHYDGSSFIVRNAGHSAGFDEKTQLKVF
ncbi:hypothetical protein O3M35_009389 [Rhynocoris fuscipes]|uniref:Uncharacterized protein n=1 Tax=Rhynocoris fuscipes TaxID=488301 RepID=A0AAW1D3L1_9HEMI